MISSPSITAAIVNRGSIMNKNTLMLPSSLLISSFFFSFLNKNIPSFVPVARARIIAGNSKIPWGASLHRIIGPYSRTLAPATNPKK